MNSVSVVLYYHPAFSHIILYRAQESILLFAVILGNHEISTDAFNTLNLNFRPQKYYWLPYSYLAEEMWSSPREFGPQIQFKN